MSPAADPSAPSGEPGTGAAVHPGPCSVVRAHPRIGRLDPPTATIAQIHRETTEAAGTSAPAPGRRRARAQGRVAEIRVAAATESPSCEAVLLVRDPAQPEGRAQPLRLVWQGQRTVPGVRTGTELSCSGMLCAVGDQPTIFNPRFEIVARRVSR